MSDKIDFIFRFILFVAAHSLFAAGRVKKIFHGADSQLYRVCYNIMSIALFGWVMSAYRHSEVLYVVPGAWSLVMYLLQLIILVILISCLRQTGAGEFLGYAGRRSISFTTTGWYSIVRHPLYFFSIIFMALNPVMTSQWSLLTIMGTIYFLIGGLIEEKRLTDEYGEEYRDYQKKVPFMIPFTISNRS